MLATLSVASAAAVLGRSVYLSPPQALAATATALGFEQLDPGVAASELWSWATVTGFGSLATGVNIIESAPNPANPGNANGQLSFAAPSGESLAPGDYSTATGAAFGLPDPACTATFRVLSIAADAGGSVTEFAATYVDTCPPDVRSGEVHWNDPLTPAKALVGMTYSNIPWTYIGKQSAAATVSLTNSGAVSIVLGSRTYLGDGNGYSDANDYGVSQDTCSGATIASGASCHLTVTTSQWLPGGHALAFRYPANTPAGQVTMSVSSPRSIALPRAITPTRIVDTRIGLGIGSALATSVPRTFTVVDRNAGDATRNVPPDAVAVAMNVTVTGSTSSGYVSVSTDPAAKPAVSTLNVPAHDTRANGATVRLSATGTLSATWVGTAGSTAHVVVDVVAYYLPSESPDLASAGSFIPVSTTRILDTRSGVGLTGAFAANTPRTLTVPLPAGRGSATAIYGNVTVVGQSAGGYISITPIATASPSTSTINFPTGDIRANNFFVELGPSATIAIVYRAPAGSHAHIVVDLVAISGPFDGYGLAALVPNRVLDTRIGLGLSGKFTSGVGRYPLLRDRHPTDATTDIPPPYTTTGNPILIAAVIGNLTVTRQTAAGYLAVDELSPYYEPPKTSTLNFPVGDNRANGAVTVEQPRIFYHSSSSGASTDVVFDVSGYFTR